MASEESAMPSLEATFREGVEALNRRDFDAAASGYATDAVFDVSLFGLEGVFEGREAIRGFFEDWVRPYEEPVLRVEEFRHLGGGVTVAVLLQRGRPIDSSSFVDLRFGGVATWADGLVTGWRSYGDIDEARTAAERLAQERE